MISEGLTQKEITIVESGEKDTATVNITNTTDIPRQGFEKHTFNLDGSVQQKDGQLAQLEIIPTDESSAQKMVLFKTDRDTSLRRNPTTPDEQNVMAQVYEDEIAHAAATQLFWDPIPEAQKLQGSVTEQFSLLPPSVKAIDKALGQIILHGVADEVLTLNEAIKSTKGEIEYQLPELRGKHAGKLKIRMRQAHEISQLGGALETGSFKDDFEDYIVIVGTEQETHGYLVFSFRKDKISTNTGKKDEEEVEIYDTETIGRRLEYIASYIDQDIANSENTLRLTNTLSTIERDQLEIKKGDEEYIDLLDGDKLNEFKALDKTLFDIQEKVAHFNNSIYPVLEKELGIRIADYIKRGGYSKEVVSNFLKGRTLDINVNDIPSLEDRELVKNWVLSIDVESEKRRLKRSSKNSIRAVKIDRLNMVQTDARLLLRNFFAQMINRNIREKSQRQTSL